MRRTPCVSRVITSYSIHYTKLYDGSLSFVRGIVTGEDGRPVLNFSGTIKKKRKQP